VKQTLAFAGLSVGLVVLVVAVTLPLLASGPWMALVAAGGMALAFQVALHVILSPWRRDPKRFLKAIVAGASARLVLIVMALIWVSVREHPHPVALMLSLAGFVCGLLMMEATLENSNWYRTLKSEQAVAARPTAPVEGVAHR